MGKPGRPACERVGQRYGLVRVIERRGSDRHGQARWLVRCEGELAEGGVCGVFRVCSGRSLDDCPPTTHIACKRPGTAIPGPGAGSGEPAAAP